MGVAAYEAITVTHVVVTGAALTATAITMNGINSYSRNRDYSVQDNTNISRPKLQAILKTEDSSKSGEKTEQSESNNDKTYNRVKVRKGTREKVAENQSKNGGRTDVRS